MVKSTNDIKYCKWLIVKLIDIFESKTFFLVVFLAAFFIENVFSFFFLIFPLTFYKFPPQKSTVSPKKKKQFLKIKLENANITCRPGRRFVMPFYNCRRLLEELVENSKPGRITRNPDDGYPADCVFLTFLSDVIWPD